MNGERIDPSQYPMLLNLKNRSVEKLIDTSLSRLKFSPRQRYAATYSQKVKDQYVAARLNNMNTFVQLNKIY